MGDNIRPDHYQVGGIETWDYLKAKMTQEELKGFAIGNVMKYLSRTNHKNGLEDIKKAMADIKTAGGELLSEEPQDIPGIGLWISFRDSEGNRMVIGSH